MEYPESTELQDVYELLRNEQIENEQLRKDEVWNTAEIERLRSVQAELVAALTFMWERVTTNEEGFERGERGWHATFEYEELEQLRAALAKAEVQR